MKMKDNKIEFRSYSAELRIENVESRKVSGLAIPVESRSQLLGGEFYETISREAVDESLIRNNDVRLLMDHEPTRGSLGRSKYGEGTLKLTIDERGLNYEIDMPNTPFGNEVLDAVRRGDVDAVSFGFYCGKDEWRKNLDGTYERRILGIDKLIEISLLDVAPAYTATDVTMRSLEEFKRSLDDKKDDEKDDEKEPDDPKEEEKEKEDDTDNNGDNSDNDTITDNSDDKKDDEELKALYDKLNKIKLEFDNLVND